MINKIKKNKKEIICIPKKKLNWTPKISFEQLVKEMIDEDLKQAKMIS